MSDSETPDVEAHEGETMAEYAKRIGYVRLRIVIGLDDSSRFSESYVSPDVIADERVFRAVVEDAAWVEMKQVRERYLNGERFLLGES